MFVKSPRKYQQKYNYQTVCVRILHQILFSEKQYYFSQIIISQWNTT